MSRLLIRGIIVVVVVVVIIIIIVIVVVIVNWVAPSRWKDSARNLRANLTCLSLSFSLGSRSTARSLLPRRLVRAQEVSQKGLQHAEEKGDKQTERETRKGKGQRRKRETEQDGEGDKGQEEEEEEEEEEKERNIPRYDTRVRENRRRRTRISRAEDGSPRDRRVVLGRRGRGRPEEVEGSLSRNEEKEAEGRRTV